MSVSFQSEVRRNIPVQSSYQDKFDADNFVATGQNGVSNCSRVRRWHLFWIKCISTTASNLADCIASYNRPAGTNGTQASGAPKSWKIMGDNSRDRGVAFHKAYQNVPRSFLSVVGISMCFDQLRLSMKRAESFDFPLEITIFMCTFQPDIVAYL